MKAWLFSLFILALTLILPLSLFAGWTEDVRLTHRRFEIYPQVAARGDTVHIAWQQIAGTKHVSYLRSTDGGHTWPELRNLEDTATHYGVRQDLWLTPDYVFVGWEDVIRGGVIPNIGYSYSIDGNDWQGPGYVFPDGVGLYDLGTAAFRDSIYAVYFAEEIDTTHTHPLRFLYSSDMGATWSPAVTVGHVDEYTNFLHVAHCRSNLYAVWASDMPPLGGIREVMAAVSHDGGVSWSDVMQLSSPDTAAAQRTCVACDEATGRFAVGWMDYGMSHGFPGDLFVRLTTDGGYTWRPESHATTHHGAWDSGLAIAGDTIWAAWTDVDYSSYGAGNEEICFSKSTNLGTSWHPYERLTYEPEHSFSPGIAYDGGKLQVVWYNYNPQPDSGMDIYYKRYDPEPDAINENRENVPTAIGISAYPNPFNSSVSISYSNLGGGEIGIYDIQGKLLKLFTLEGGGDGKINWDACDASGEKVSCGIYFVRARTSQSSRLVKLIYLK
jgi:hypothetical protein